MHIQFIHRILLKLHKTPLCIRLDCEEFFKAHSCNSPEIPTSKIEERGKKEMAYYRMRFIFVLAEEGRGGEMFKVKVDAESVSHANEVLSCQSGDSGCFCSPFFLSFPVEAQSTCAQCAC